MEDRLRNLLLLNKEQMESLIKARINSSRSFLQRSDYQLGKILKVSMKTIQEMKYKLKQEQTVELISGTEFFDNYLEKSECFITGISQLDECFPNGIISGDIIEIFGLAESGKTMLLNTMMIGLLEIKENDKILFIDTKRDFHALRLKIIMDEREIPQAKQEAIMRRISVEDVTTLEDIISSLTHIANNSFLHENLKFIIIDSITVPTFLYLGEPIYCIGRLTEVAQLLQNLSVQKYIILVTNLAVQETIETPSGQSSESDSPDSEKTSTYVQLKPALGQFWENVPHHKVLMDFHDFRRRFRERFDPVKRQISLFRSKTLKSTEPKHVTISNSGVW